MTARKSRSLSRPELYPGFAYHQARRCGTTHCLRGHGRPRDATLPQRAVWTLQRVSEGGQITHIPETSPSSVSSRFSRRISVLLTCTRQRNLRSARLLGRELPKDDKIRQLYEMQFAHTRRFLRVRASSVYERATPIEKRSRGMATITILNHP